MCNGHKDRGQDVWTRDRNAFELWPVSQAAVHSKGSYLKYIESLLNDPTAFFWDISDFTFYNFLLEEKYSTISF